MKNRYIDLIEQTFEFPQEGFEVIDNQLHFNEIPLMDIIEQYGTPLKITYLPKISSQIQKAKRLFNVAMAKADYEGNYLYCYCTKSSHFEFVLNEALKNDIHLETSSAFDLPIIKELAKTDRIHKDNIILCNGFKRDNYIEGIADLLGDGFKNVIPILDNKEELNDLQEGWKGELQIGLRIAAEEEPNAEFYTSRLGIRYNEIIDFYKNVIANNKNVKLKLLHFFINTGVKDTAYYWSELQKNINLYCELKNSVRIWNTSTLAEDFQFAPSWTSTTTINTWRMKLFVRSNQPVNNVMCRNQISSQNLARLQLEKVAQYFSVS